MTFISSAISTFVKELKSSAGKDIWLVGGAEVISSCIQHDLIDEFVISVHPIILGDGIPLFRAPLSMRKLNFLSCQTFDTGLIQVTYVRRPTPENA